MSTGDARGRSGSAEIRIPDASEAGQAAAGAVEAYFDSAQARLKAGDPLLTPRQQAEATKGLPTRENLRKLARVWLERAHEAWPELCASGIVPALTDESVEQLVDAFTRRFVEGRVECFISDAPCGPWKGLGVSYLRYSSDNSNPRSLDDQLHKQLTRAREEGRFIPWEYVFADASVTGRTHLRRSYRLAKKVFEDSKDPALDTLYFDDFSRASRSAIESYRLAKLMERLKRRMIGVSDGFDLHTPGTDVLLMATAMYNEMFVKQLRDKVLRGMRGAMERGTSTGRVRFGYQLVPERGADGKPVMRDMGAGVTREVKVIAIDPEAMKWVLQAAEWFAYEFKSYNWITKQFNALKVGGRQSWSVNAISQILASPLYIGVRIYNRTSMILDTDTGALTTTKNPRREWIVKVIPELKAWSDDLWKAVRRRAAAVRRAAPATGRKKTHNELHPTTLLSGTLQCECGREIVLDRSAGKYKQFCCPDGRHGRRGCQNRSGKSVRIVEEAVLAHVMNQVLTPENMTKLVNKANEHLFEEAQRPRVPTAPIRKELQRLKEQKEQLIDFVIAHEAKGFDMADYLRRGEKLQDQIANLQAKLTEVEANNAPPPAPISLEDVLTRLEDLRGLLYQSVEKSAVMLRTLTGPIVVRQVKEPHKRGATWIGRMKADAGRFIAAAAKRGDLGDYPDAETWVIRNARNWITPTTVEIPLKAKQAHERIMPQVLELKASGMSTNQIATALGKPWLMVQRALVAADRR